MQIVFTNLQLANQQSMNITPCYHCGEPCKNTDNQKDEKYFCCNGCKTVYEIFLENELTCYYDFQKNPGAIPADIKGKYDFLDTKSIAEKLIEFDDGVLQIITFFIPHIHCSSCIWVLENLHKFNPKINASQVDFPKKTVRITFQSKEISLKDLVMLLSSIGYEPYISLDDYDSRKNAVDRSLIYKLAIAGFAFGNVMFLSFPEYFEVSEFWLDQYKNTFRWLMFLFSIPVVFYAGNHYFIAAFKGLKSKILNIDVPIALGIAVLFIRSFIEILFDLGSGFFDSLTGLIFFLLLGKFFQQKTYHFLSFERDYKSYFPIAVTKILTNGKEENIQIYEIKKGDRLLIRNQELIPVDGFLINGNAQIDYSFVTGEAVPVPKKLGDKLYAGGKQLAGFIEMEVLASVSQSYLTQLWSNDVFKKDKSSNFKNITDTISKKFTIFVLTVATLATAFWLFFDISKALNVFTAVLIIACPCAIALAAPFTLGNLLRIFGNKKFYLKNASVIEQLANIKCLIFDKTGTLTTTKESTIFYEGIVMNSEEMQILKSALRASNHPLSRIIYNTLNNVKSIPIENFKEIPGKGIEVHHQHHFLKIGAVDFVKNTLENKNLDTAVHVSFDEIYKGKFTLKNTYRNGLKSLFEVLKNNFELAIVSGDNSGEENFLRENLPNKTTLLFNKKPEDKLQIVADFQSQNKKVAMFGDGLNDAAALAKSDVGIAISENINVFSPACDAILDASQFQKINQFLWASKKGVSIIKYSFLLSFCYNVIGLYFAVTGQLMPVIAAILMPLSSISIVVFTTICTNYIGKKIS